MPRLDGSAHNPLNPLDNPETGAEGKILSI